MTKEEGGKLFLVLSLGDELIQTSWQRRRPSRRPWEWLPEEPRKETTRAARPCIESY